MPAWDFVVPLGGTAVVASYIDVQKKKVRINGKRHKVYSIQGLQLMSSSKLQSDDTTHIIENELRGKFPNLEPQEKNETSFNDCARSGAAILLLVIDATADKIYLKQLRGRLPVARFQSNYII
jgi:hypothetical protein